MRPVARSITCASEGTLSHAAAIRGAGRNIQLGSLVRLWRTLGWQIAPCLATILIVTVRTVPHHKHVCKAGNRLSDFQSSNTTLWCCRHCCSTWLQAQREIGLEAQYFDLNVQQRPKRAIP